MPESEKFVYEKESHEIWRLLFAGKLVIQNSIMGVISWSCGSLTCWSQARYCTCCLKRKWITSQTLEMQCPSSLTFNIFNYLMYAQIRALQYTARTSRFKYNFQVQLQFLTPLTITSIFHRIRILVEINARIAKGAVKIYAETMWSMFKCNNRPTIISTNCPRVQLLQSVQISLNKSQFLSPSH